MGKNPSTIFRGLYRKCRDRSAKAKSTDSTNAVIDMEQQDGCYYVPWKEVIQNFMVEGYGERKAIAHIEKWLDYEMITTRYSNGFKYIGFPKKGVF